jgi:hypothetical protein
MKHMLSLKLVVALFISLLLLSSPGCLGRMVVSSGVKEFNMNVVDSRWGRETVFVALYIIPVYPTCAFLDLCVVNAVEFWNGENPISGESALVDE